MNLLDKVSSTDELIDMSISILQEAKSNGFSGFGGMCAQATVIINELLFDGKQVNFASFNKSLEKKNQYIGHVACLVELNDDEYVIFDSLFDKEPVDAYILGFSVENLPILPTADFI